MIGRKSRAAAVAALAAGLLPGLPAESSTSAPQPPPEAVAKAQEIRLIDGQVFESATPLEFKAAMYPRRRAEVGGEGWVALRFIVTTDGTVRNPVVQDSSHRDFEQPALDAVRAFRYRPAQLDGQPVEFIVPMYRITFRLEPRSEGARPVFAQRLRRLQRDFDRGDLEGAEKWLAALDDLGAHNLYEDAYLWQARAMLHRARNDLRSWRESILRALAYAGEGQPGGLPADPHRHSLELLYADYTRTGEIAAAVHTFDDLVALVGPARVNPELRAHAQTLRNTLAGDDVLRAQGYVDGDRAWSHTLWRDGFEFDDIVGRLDKLSLWCERRAIELEIDPESSWQVPSSWGSCQLYVRGEPGTSFSIVEYSTAAEGAPPRP